MPAVPGRSGDGQDARGPLLIDRRRLARVELSEANDSGLIAVIPGERLAGMTWSSVLNVGFNDLSCRLLGPGGAERWPLAAAQEVMRRWWFGVWRLSLQGESVWQGRVWDVTLGDFGTDRVLGESCTLDLRCIGPALSELTRETPTLPDSMTSETASISLAGLVEALIDEQGGLIAREYSRVTQTSTDLGPIAAGVSDLALSLITGKLRVAGGEGEELTFLVEEFDQGPIVRALCDCGDHAGIRWALPATGSVALRGDEAYSRVEVLFTDADGIQRALSPVDDAVGLALQAGIRRSRTVTLDRVSAAAAEAAAQSALVLHRDPRAIASPLRYAASEGSEYPLLPNDEGGREPGWRARAGQAARLGRFLPHDAAANDAPGGLIAIVESARYSLDEAALDIALDQRRIRARRAEDQRGNSALQRDLEPTTSDKPIVKAVNEPGTTQTFTGLNELVTIIGEAGVITFVCPRRRLWTISAEANVTPGAAQTAHLIIGYALDDEGFTSSVAEVDRLGNLKVTASSDSVTVQMEPKRVILPGLHTLRLYIGFNDGAQTMTLTAFRVEVRP